MDRILHDFECALEMIQSTQEATCALCGRVVKYPDPLLSITYHNECLDKVLEETPNGDL